MAAKPKMTPEEWARAREVWEADPRDGYAWLVDALGLDVSVQSVRKAALKWGWVKVTPGNHAKAPATIKTTMPTTIGNSGDDASGTPGKPTGDEVLGAVIHQTMGRPTLYRTEYAEMAYRLCLLGATDAHLGGFFGVTEQTINNWKGAFPDFFESMREGKIVADANVAQGLYKRATGYSHPDVAVNVVAGEVVLTELVKHYPPDTTAAKLWLINRQPDKWRDKVEVKADVNLNVFPPREVLDAMYQKALAEAAERDAVLRNRRERLGIVIDNGDSRD